MSQFGSSTASWWSAEAVQDKVPDPETAGWGSTLVGEVMKAKVGPLGLFGPKLPPAQPRVPRLIMSIYPGRAITLQEDSGAWLWCSADDMVIDAVRKVGLTSGSAYLLFREGLGRGR